MAQAAGWHIVVYHGGEARKGFAGPIDADRCVCVWARACVYECMGWRSLLDLDVKRALLTLTGVYVGMCVCKCVGRGLVG